MSLARQSCTALAPSVIEPPPIVTMRSAFAARACSLAAMTAARGVCGGIASKVPTQCGPSAWRMVSITSVSRLRVPLTIRKARFAPSRLTCSTSASDAGRPNTTSSMAPNTTRPLCTLVLPGTSGLVASLGSLGALTARLAEEIRAVMPDVVGRPQPRVVPPRPCAAEITRDEDDGYRRCHVFVRRRLVAVLALGGMMAIVRKVPHLCRALRLFMHSDCA